MNKKITIAIDAMGGENAPKKNLEGLNIFLKKNNSNNDFFINLYGDEKIINDQLKILGIKNSSIKVVHTNDVVSDAESPITAVKNSKNSSMWMSVKSQVDDNTDITLSAGNTGVLLVISRMILKTMKEVSKPALAGLWPSKKEMSVVLDLGANVVCDEKNLIDFSELGAALYKSIFPKKVPIVSLLNIGSEEIKGTDVLKKTYSELKRLSSDNNFLFNGYIEGNKLMEGETNVIITDGFTGNIALKTAEGTAKFITDSLKKSLSENMLSKISILFSYFSLKKFKSKLDPRKYNGAIFMGVNGISIKSHGSATPYAFSCAIQRCYDFIYNDINKKIKNNFNLI